MRFIRRASELAGIAIALALVAAACAPYDVTVTAFVPAPLPWAQDCSERDLELDAIVHLGEIASGDTVHVTVNNQHDYSFTAPQQVEPRARASSWAQPVAATACCWCCGRRFALRTPV